MKISVSRMYCSTTMNLTKLRSLAKLSASHIQWYGRAKHITLFHVLGSFDAFDDVICVLQFALAAKSAMQAIPKIRVS